MINITNEQQLRNIIMKDIIPNILQSVAQKISDKLMDIVNSEWYNGHSASQIYERTYSFLNSITTKKINKNTFEIFFDPEKMSTSDPIYDYESGGDLVKLGSRTSLNFDTSYGGKSISEWLIQWINDGQNSSFLSYEGINMFETAREELRTDLDKFIMEAFAEIGITNVKKN